MEEKTPLRLRRFDRLATYCPDFIEMAKGDLVLAQKLLDIWNESKDETKHKSSWHLKPFIRERK